MNYSDDQIDRAIEAFQIAVNSVLEAESSSKSAMHEGMRAALNTITPSSLGNGDAVDSYNVRIPYGMALVPIEPTHEMLVAAQLTNGKKQLPRFSVLRTRWAAMVDAALAKGNDHG